MSIVPVVPIIPVANSLKRRSDLEDKRASQFLYTLSPNDVATRMTDYCHFYKGMGFSLFNDAQIRAFFEDLSNQYVHPIYDVLRQGELFRFGQRIHLYVTPSRLLSFLKLSNVDDLTRWFHVENPMDIDLSTLGMVFSSSTSDIYSLFGHLVGTFPTDIPGVIPYITIERTIQLERFDQQTALVYHAQRKYPWLYTTKVYSPSITYVFRLTIVMRFPQWVVNEDIRKRVKDVLSFYCQSFPFMTLDSKWLTFQLTRWNQYSIRMAKIPWFGTTLTVPCPSCKTDWVKKMRMCHDCGQTGHQLDHRVRSPEWSELPILAPDGLAAPDGEAKVEEEPNASWITWDRWNTETLDESTFILFCGACRIHGTKVEHDYLISSVLTRFVEKMSQAAEDEAERQRQLVPVQIPLSMRRPVRQCRLTYRPTLQIDDEVSRQVKKKQMTDQLWTMLGYPNPYRSKKMNEEVVERWRNFLTSCRTLFGLRFPDHLVIHSPMVRRNREDQAAFLVQREEGSEPESREHPRCVFFAVRLVADNDVNGTLECVSRECKDSGDQESYGLKVPLNLVKATYDGEHRAAQLPIHGGMSSHQHMLM